MFNHFNNKHNNGTINQTINIAEANTDIEIGNQKKEKNISYFWTIVVVLFLVITSNFILMRWITLVLMLFLIFYVSRKMKIADNKDLLFNRPFFYTLQVTFFIVATLFLFLLPHSFQNWLMQGNFLDFFKTVDFSQFQQVQIAYILNAFLQFLICILHVIVAWLLLAIPIYQISLPLKTLLDNYELARFVYWPQFGLLAIQLIILLVTHPAFVEMLFDKLK